jgi:hypothetical protein
MFHYPTLLMKEYRRIFMSMFENHYAPYASENDQIMHESIMGSQPGNSKGAEDVGEMWEEDLLP